MLPIPNDGRCTSCDSDSWILARDLTEYSPADFDGFRWHVDGVSLERLDTPSRFYCSNCGTYHQTPADLED